MTKRYLADVIIQTLEASGVDVIFGVPGGAIEPLYNAMSLSAQRYGLSPIHARHESGAAFMAHGHALISGKMGVCCATTGPGATNLFTGVASAYMDQVPMLVLTGQNHHTKMGKPALQDSSTLGVDTVSAFSTCTKMSALVPHASSAIQLLKKAIALANTPPFGPVHLSFPTDILNTLTEDVATPLHAMLGERIRQDIHASLKVRLSLSASPCLYIGRRANGLWSSIVRYVEAAGIPFVTSPQGKFWVDSKHPLCAGVFGFAGHASADQALMDADLILSIGANMEELSTCGWSTVLCNDKLICVSDNPNDLDKSLGLGEVWIDKPKPVLEHLYKNALDADFYRATPKTSPYDIAHQEAAKQHEFHPGIVLHKLLSLFPEETNTFIDAGNSWAWYLHYVSSARAFIEANFGAMGWSVGAAVGAAFASGTMSVSVVGDGAWMMNGNEFSTAIANNLPVLVIVMNDSALGMVKHGQRLSKSEDICNQLPETRYADIATAMGAASLRIATMDDLNHVDINTIVLHRKPFLIEILVDNSIEPPMGKRMESLMQVAHAPVQSTS